MLKNGILESKVFSFEKNQYIIELDLAMHEGGNHMSETLQFPVSATDDEIDFDSIEVINKDVSKKDKWILNLKRRKWSLIFIIPTLIYVIIFCYVPMYGIVIAFQDFIPGDSMFGGNAVWVGWENFHQFFSIPNFQDIFLNTFTLCLLGFIVGFPLPIIVALLLNSLRSKKLQKVIQTIFYAPHFISLVVLVGMLFIFFGSNGLINHLIELFGGARFPFFLEKEAFQPLFIFSGNWQDFGWSAIIYLAALAGVDPALHEAAKIDGASRFKRIFSVDLPAILPTISMLLILSIGNLMSCGYEKVLLMQTDGNIEKSQILSTYVYNMGLVGGNYSLSTAAGLFNSVINITLLVIANYTSKKFSENSMW
jgi:putative aldouronate transport system permease protein